MGMYDIPYLTERQCEEAIDSGLDAEVLYEKYGINKLLERAHKRLLQFAVGKHDLPLEDGEVWTIEVTQEEAMNMVHVTDTYPNIPGVTSNWPGSDLPPAEHSNSILAHECMITTSALDIHITMLETKQYSEEKSTHNWALKEPEIVYVHERDFEEERATEEQAKERQRQWVVQQARELLSRLYDAPRYAIPYNVYCHGCMTEAIEKMVQEQLDSGKGLHPIWAASDTELRNRIATYYDAIVAHSH